MASALSENNDAVTPAKAFATSEQMDLAGFYELCRQKRSDDYEKTFVVDGMGRRGLPCSDGTDVALPESGVVGQGARR